MRKVSLLLVIALLLLVCSPALATIDPEGEAFRDRLAKILQADDTDSFNELVETEPQLSKRAFVIEFLQVWENRPKEESEDSPRPEVTELANRLAGAIYKIHNDTKPLQICDRFLYKNFDVASYELGRYAEDVHPGYVDSSTVAGLNSRNLEVGIHYGAGALRRADYDDINFAILYPILLNQLRSKVAEAYLDPALLIRELGLSSRAVRASDELLLEVYPEYDPLALKKQEKLQAEWSKLVHRAIFVSFGLSSDIDADSLAEFETQGELKSPENGLAILLIRYQAAYRSARLDDARGILADIEHLVGENLSEMPALFRFLVRTMQTQCRLDSDTLSDQEIREEYSNAWNELKYYKPGVKILEDRYWWAARSEVKYWIQKLPAADPRFANVGELESMSDDLIRWLLQSRETRVKDYYTSNELWLQAEEVWIHLNQLLVLTDLLSYHLEKVGADVALEDVPEGIDALESLISRLTTIPDAYNLNPDEDLFPKLEFENSSLMRELRLRVGYIKAVAEAITKKEQQVERLLALIPDLQHLDRPDSYIHYHSLFASEFRKRGRLDLAIPLLQQSLQHADKYSFRTREIELASTLAEIFSEQGEWEKAAAYSERVKSSLQSKLSTSAPKDALDMGKHGRNAGEIQAVAQIKTDNPQAAFEALSAGQQLESAATQLAANRAVRGELNSISKKRESVEVLERQVQTLQQLPDSETKAEILEANQKQLAQTRSEFMLESRKLRSKYPKLYTTTLRFDPLVLPDVQEALPPDAAVVQYFSTANEMFIFAVTQDSFHLRSVSLDQKELDGLVLSYLKILRGAQGGEELAYLSQKLHSLLIEPITKDIAGRETLILIPSGRLNSLPFAALQDRSGQPLAAHKRLVTLAKATDFMKVATGKPKPLKGMVAFANATLDLPSAEREGEKIKEIFPGTKLFVGLEANRGNLLKFAAEADVLHLATHGLSDPVDALNNYLALSENGKLTQEEIFNLELADTSLVTLSACNTALSNTTEYEFVASIAEAFWIAGSRSVVASVWPVDDKSTEILMTEFYRGLKEKGLGKAEALQQAQLKVRADPRFEHPYYWAGFILFGDYR